MTTDVDVVWCGWCEEGVSTIGYFDHEIEEWVSICQKCLDEMIEELVGLVRAARLRET